MADLDIIEFPDGTQHNLRDTRVDDLDDAIKDTTNPVYHLGFYLDSNGGLCQVNEI